MGKLCTRDAQAMHKIMRKMMFGYEIKAMHRGCARYAKVNAQDDNWV